MLNLRTRTGRYSLAHVSGMLLFGALFVLSAPPAHAQNDRPPAQAERREERGTGFFGQVGDWFDRQFNNIKTDLKSAKDNFDRDTDRATKTAKDAADAVAKLPEQRTVRGRERCPVAPNGAPDCEAAASAMCKAKGYGSGKSIDATTAETCPPQVLLSGRSPAPGECKSETFISRAMCSP
jgi:uncharacterized membrane protein